MSTSPIQRDQTVKLAAEALLREHPDALVCGLSSNGLITPLPQSVGLWGQAAIEGRAVIDSVVAGDRTKVVELWQRVERDGVAEGKVRLLNKPSRSVTLHFLDLQAFHDVLLCVILPSDEPVEESEGDEDAIELPPAAPRFSSLLEDEGAKVIACDDAFTEMFGYTSDELIGNSVLDQIHPDDQGRAVEGWLAVLSTRRNQQTRLRRRRRDGSYVWVDTTLHNYLHDPEREYVLVELIDVSAEMVAQEALQEREELLRRLTDAMPDGLLQLDTDRELVYHNARLLNILQTSSSGVSPGAPTFGPDEPGRVSAQISLLLSTLTTEGLRTFERALDSVLGEGADRDVEVDYLLSSGEWRRALMSVRALLRPNGEVSGAITSVLDVTDSARAREELEKRATFDALTGALNRSALLDAAERELERTDAAYTALVYVDLDNFKPVNDTLGHSAGDELLILVAERLKDVGRREDDVGRLGGDEFVMLLRDVSGPEVAMDVARRICASLNTPVELSGGIVELRASVGVGCASGAIKVEQLIKRADSAMYVSKRQGKGLPALDAESAGLPDRAQAVVLDAA